MKQCSQTLQTMLESSDVFRVADLVTFILTSGDKLYYTSSSSPVRQASRQLFKFPPPRSSELVTVNNITYMPIPMKRSQISWQSGIDVSTLDLYLYPEFGVDTIGDISLTEAFCNGTFDGAFMQLDKAFYSNWSTAPEILEAIFVGRVDIDTVSKTQIKLEIKSPTELLNIKSPTLIFQPQCNWILYSAPCGVSKSDYTFTSTVLGGSTARTIRCDLTQPNDYFTYGVWTGTSGSNINVTRSIKSYTSGTIVFTHPLLSDPQIGDTFTVCLGCKKDISDCEQKFNNRDNYGGKPYIPLSETIVG